MLIPPLRVRCLEYRTRMEGGQTRPLVVWAEDDDGNGRDFVMKVRTPDNSDNHFGATSLAAELICSALARGLGLDVPDYAIIDVPADFPDVVPDAEVRGLLQTNTGPNFGCAFIDGLQEWDPRYQFASDGHRGLLEDILLFDGIVLNDDRRASRPNLLWRGPRIVVIDHSLALAIHVWRPGGTNEQTTLTDVQVRDHAAYPALAGRERPFETVLHAWHDEVTDATLEELRGFIPPEWEQHPGHLDQIFEFLRRRPMGFASVRMNLRRVVK